MLHFTKSFFLLVIITFIFSGCKKDDEIVPKNIVTYDGTDFELASGLILDFGQLSSSQGNAQVLFLYSSGIKIHESGGKIDSTSGTGHTVYFEIFSPTSTILGDGEYTFDPYFTYKAKTFSNSYTVFNANYATSQGEFHEIMSGKVVVKKEGNDYTITFDCKEDLAGKQLTGFYKGSLKVYDEK
ncbi:hypothetical protein [Dyadobacter frigoris]|uniref:Uncharacterized protein n=1 Tax=Dyadobacter frigoris TaxID=2576211 RepID=A0A4U6D5K6_9BACT|nr:hypothetical protein [Dyadobacter frigoris]TKT91986.1 hypothetical protein FDK13_12660 [Dyadobacter frigoris]GLU53138.1 hypothetical protein Dfri01_25990 [Dyadobacter frigoris]